MASPSGTGDRARRSALLAMKLAALVREHGVAAPAEAATFGGGAAATVGTDGWVLLEDQPERGLGPALAWALRARVSALNLVGERAMGIVARRAELMAFPVQTWHAIGRRLVPAVAEPYPVPVEPAADELALMEVIRAAGVDPVVEHGVVAGEVAGLEVCRVVRSDDGTVRLEVGVGAHDREAFQLVHGDVPTVDALRTVAAAVAGHRRAGGPPHPLQHLAAERLLRHRILAEPALVGCAVLAAAPPPVVRTTLKDPVPCIARGRTEAGADVVVAVAGNADLDLATFGADARAALAPAAELRLALAGRNALPVIRELAALTRPPATVWPVD
jgi:hypothetical protein